MKQEDLAYIAGLVDADGWITLTDNNSAVSFATGIVNTDREVLEWVLGSHGGAIREPKRPRSRENKNWKQVYIYELTSDSVKGFLGAILPFLRIKKRQAEIVLEFLETRARRGHKGTYRTPPEIVEKRNQWLREVQALNRIGRMPKLNFNGQRIPKDPNKPRKPGRWPVKQSAELATPQTSGESPLPG